MRTALPPPEPSLADTPQASAPSDTADILEFIAILRRRKLFVLAPPVLLVALALIYGMLATKLFTAETSLLYNPRPRTSLTAEPTAVISAADQALVDSQARLLQAENILRRVIDREGLIDDSEFAGGRASLLGVILGALGLRSAETPADREARVVTALDTLSRNVTVNRTEKTYLFGVAVTTSDPQKSARLANAIVRAYMDDQTDARIEAARAETSLLRTRLDELQNRVRDAERRVELFRAENGLFAINGRPVTEQQLSEATDGLVEAKTRTAAAKAKADQIQRLLRQGQLPDAVPDSLRLGTLEKLRQQYAEIIRQEASLRRTLGPRHPAYLEVQQQLQETRRLINEDLRRVAAAATNELQLARDQEAAQQREIDQIKDVTRSTNQSMVRLRELERDVEASRIVYERFLRARETIGPDLVDSANVRVIAPATPPQYPSSPRRIPLVLAGIGAGLAMGVVAALLAEFMSIKRGQRSPAPLPSPLAATVDRAGRRSLDPFRVLATLPAPSRGFGLGKLLHTSARPADMLTIVPLRPKSAYTRAVESLAEAMVADGLLQKGRTLLITSAQPATGKSTLAMNLAWARASAGARVLIVDAHRAHPTLSSLTSATEGMLSLFGRESRVVCLGPDWESGPVLLPCATPGEAATTSPLTLVANRFDAIIIDAAAVSGDPALRTFAILADDVILVGPTEATDAGAAAFASLDVPLAKLKGFIGCHTA